MNRLLLLPGVMLFAAVMASAAPVPKALAKKAKSDLELMEGRWLVEQIDSGKGLAAPQGDWATFYWRVENGKLFTGTTGGPGYRGVAFTLNPDQSPKQMDVVQNGSAMPYIYDLDGDTLKTVHSSAGQPRPADFNPTNGHYVFVWKRVKE